MKVGLEAVEVSLKFHLALGATSPYWAPLDSIMMHFSMHCSSIACNRRSVSQISTIVSAHLRDVYRIDILRVVETSGFSSGFDQRQCS